MEKKLNAWPKIEEVKHGNRISKAKSSAGMV